MDKYSIKMRASKQTKVGTVHISGAERIIYKSEIPNCTTDLISRAMNHTKGNADFINLKIEEVKEPDILYLDALPVSQKNTSTKKEGLEAVREILRNMQIEQPDEILKHLSQTYGMRGAMLLNVDTLERMEPDFERGVRATYMDAFTACESSDNKKVKNHFNEAIVLATKVANAPGIIGEICISDDPDYVTGYVASKELGYVRIMTIKELGSPDGGRIFLYRGTREDAARTIDFLQKQCVLVRNLPKLKEAKPCIQNKWSVMENKLHEMKNQNLYRTMKTLESAQSSHVTWQGKDLLMFTSNSYLDMCNEPEVKVYVKGIIDQYGTGSGGSRLTTGNTVLHDELERRLAAFKGTENAIVFNTGYVANVAILQAICQKGDIILSDELNHASIIDGCRLSKAEVILYKHNDMEDLRKKAQSVKGRNGVIVSDAVFSMDGDILHLPEFMEIADESGLFSMVDEAHSTGVLGKTGKGIIEHFHLTRNPDILMGTLSKSIGSEGGFVCGSNVLIEYLRNTARGFIFSTSLSPATIASSIKALDILQKDSTRVEQLQKNIGIFTKVLQKEGIPAYSETAIIPIVIGDEEKVMHVSEELLKNGYFISAIRYPTVAKGSARLRVALMSSHTEEELIRTAKCIGKIVGCK